MIIKYRHKWYESAPEKSLDSCEDCIFSDINSDPNDDCYGRYERELKDISTCVSMHMIFKNYSISKLMKEL